MSQYFDIDEVDGVIPDLMESGKGMWFEFGKIAEMPTQEGI